MTTPDAAQTTGQRTSMAKRGKTPGLKYGRHRLPYWIASNIIKDTLGFPDKCVPLPKDADEETLSRLCHELTARLHAWLSAVRAGEDGSETIRPRARYDGSVESLCRVFQEHPDSPIHEVKRNTYRTYSGSLNVIVSTVGRRVIRNVTALDVRRWYRLWRRPKEPGGRERVDRAHDAVSTFRMVLRFGAALRHKECGELDHELKMLRFEKGAAREQELNYEHVVAFLRAADDLAARGVMPADRALYMSIGIAAQFELLLRQKDIIGERIRSDADLARAVRRGATTIRCPDATWAGYFCWENIPGWRWRTRTSKSKYRAAAEFDLARYDRMLFPLLERVPFDQRQGAVVKGEGGYPVQERSYRKWYRQIARAAGVPDAVWSMDARAGGATEADDAGAPIELIREGLTQSNVTTTARYIRRRGAKMDALADVRSRKRAADSGDSNAG